MDAIVVGGSPVPSTAISGIVKNADGSPLTGAEVSLSGLFFRMKTVVKADGHYEFATLPKEDFYLKAVYPGKDFSPYENFCPAAVTNAESRDFVVKPPSNIKNVSNMQIGQWKIAYNLSDGVADIFYGDKLVIPHAFAAVHLPETVTSRDYTIRRMSQQTIQDENGRGMKFTVDSTSSNSDQMIQTYWFYENASYFLADVAISGKSKMESNFMAPLISETPSDFLPFGDNRALFVPFDNDKWIRYNAMPFGNDVISHEVTALYNNYSRRGLILGSVEHDIWKTAVESTTSSNAITSLNIYGGFTSPDTRDVLPHGKISGTTVRSPKIFVGCFSDWRDGLESYARVNALNTPPRPWKGGVPFGWNSWGKLQGKISFAKGIEVSDFFAKNLQPNHFENNGVVYIGLDSGWNKFSDAELKHFVEHCRANHQQAGIYFTPFAAWRANDESQVPGSHFKYRDIFLYANGQKQILDGGVALDPTHPGTKQLIEHTIGQFKAAGFKYVKADFLTHGTLEADKFYDTRVTTGIQAYNVGMKFVSGALGKGIYLNLSISPLFPSQYANSRRIACDTFGNVDQIEYALNSLTYGWWLSGVYDFNDPDHMVLDGYSEGENRARVTSGAITGVFISGDDFSDSGDITGKERAEIFLTNPEVNNLARVKKSFRPVEGDTGSRAANLFYFEAKDFFYLAAFNYSSTNVSFNLDFNQIGIESKGPVFMREIWSGTPKETSNSMNIQINSADAKLYKLYKEKPVQTKL